VKQREARCTYIPDLGTNGVVKGFVALIQDVSEMRRNERLLADQRVRMINSSKLAAIGEMAGSLAHEINNPLSVIHGRSERLRFLAADNNLNVPEVVKTAEKIEATAMRISKIVNGLRTLSRDAEKDMTEKTRISSLIAETIELSVQRFRHHQIDLQVDQVDENLTIECKAVQISQVLLNLLNNAFDAVIGSDQPRWVRVRVASEQNQIRIAVENSGKGIPAEIRGKIFDPFFTTKEAGKGTGLGLSISRSIVEAHRGTLYLDETSEVTRFVCVLPVSLSKNPQAF